MKAVILILCSIAASAQVKCKLDTDEKDEFTGKLKRFTSWVTVGKLPGMIKLQAKVMRIDDYAAIMLSMNDALGCLTKDAKCIIKFKDGELLTLPYRGKIDCGEYLSFYSNVQDDIDKLKSTEILRVRYQLESYRDVEITEPWFIRDLLKCVGSIEQ